MLGEKLIASLCQLIDIGTSCVHVSASIGAALRTGGAQLADEWLLEADHALYAAKGEGRGKVCFHTPIV